jgi:PAS domain S-box-containing protein
LVDQNKKAEDKNSKALLRAAAESKLSISYRKAPGLKGKSIDEIIHELEVHQIELEMQNSELKNTLEALEESKDRYMDLYDFAPSGYLTISSRGVIVEANLTAATMLGVERSKLLAHGFALFISLKDLTIWEHFLVDIFHDYEKHSYELQLNRQDGSTFFALLVSTRLKLDDDTKLARIAISDITDRKLAEFELKRPGAQSQGDEQKHAPRRRELQEHRPKQGTSGSEDAPGTRLAFQRCPIHFAGVEAVAGARLRHELRPEDLNLQPFCHPLPEDIKMPSDAGKQVAGLFRERFRAAAWGLDHGRGL